MYICIYVYNAMRICVTCLYLSKGCFPVVRFFTYVYVRDAQYASINEFTCSEHSVRIRRSKKRNTGNKPLDTEIINIYTEHLGRNYSLINNYKQIDKFDV